MTITQPEPERPCGPKVLPAWQLAICFGLGYFLTAEAARFLSETKSGYVSFWLPAGAYLSALLLSERKLWPWLVSAALVADIVFDFSQGLRIGLALAFCIPNILQACSGAWLMSRFVPGRPTLATFREYAVLLGAVAVCAMLGATAGASIMVGFHLDPSFARAWLNWWTGNAMALLLIIPFAVTWAPGSGRADPPRPDKAKAIVEAVLLVVVLLGIAVRLLFFDQGVMTPNKAPLILPLIWAGIRFGPRGAASASLLLVLVFAFFTARYSIGLTAAQAASDEPMFVLQSSMLVACLVGMIPAIIIRERDRTLADLRTIEDRFELAIRGSLDGVWDWNVLTNRSFHGQRFIEMLGYSSEGDFPSTHGSFLAHLHSEDLDRTKKAIADHIERHVPFDVEFRLRTKAGEYRWFRSRGQAIWDEEGRATRMAGSIRDVTAAKEAERALLESEEKFSRAFSASPDGICITELKTGRFMEVNESYCKLYGYERQELLGRNPVELGIFKTAEVRGRFVQALLELGSVRDMDLPTHRSDGQVRLVSASAERIRLGAADCIVSVIHDVTERKQAEEQLRQSQKMEAIGQLAGGIAHDFNNMLAVIQMQTSMLISDEEIVPRAREELQNIMAAAERSANLTRQLLTFSRREVVKRAENLDLAEVVGAIIKLLRRVLGENVALETRFASALPMVKADPGMIEQVLMNLAINARDAMPRGGTMEVVLAPCDVDPERARGHQVPPGRFIRLSISDTGCGIPAEILPRIFEPFFTTKRVGEGTGLGLATTFGIIQQHQGWIEVASEVGRGATFSVFLPALEETAIRPALTAPGQAVCGGNESILLVEDEAPVRQLTRHVLEHFGYTVLEAAGPLDALQIWSSQADAIDLLLTDIVMPGGMNGRELADALLAHRPGLKVIYTSGYTNQSINQQLNLEPGRNFLQKPFSALDLAASIRRCLDEG